MNTPFKPQLTLAMVALTAIAVLLPHGAKGHCDTLDGPVVIDARAALAAGDVTPVLKWIAPEEEAAIRRAFDHVLKVRRTGEDARSLADMYFFETVVRVHRAAEGAPYTGLKPAGTSVPAPVAKADEALAKGNVDDLAERVGEHAAAGVRERFSHAVETKKHMNDSVEAGRKYVEAYVMYVHYVENVHNAVAGHAGHHSGEATKGGAEHKHD